MKHVLIVLCVLLPLFLGCSMKRDFVKMQGQVDYLESSQKEMQAKLAAADSQSRAQAQILNEIKAALWDLSEKVTAKTEIVDQLQKADSARPRVDLLPIGKAVPDTGLAAKPTAAYSAEDYKKAYDAAYLEITRRSYDLAVTGFREFIKKYPGSSLADNAQYWIGESFYAQKKYREAAAEFEKVIAQYPNQDKVPAAMLKAGLCHQDMGDKAKATSVWQSLLKRYPKSQEALLAREKLKKK
jgi:tol-pal system protein YbgF